MDSTAQLYDSTMVPYMVGQAPGDGSEASTNSYPPLRTRDEVTLSIPGFRDVGRGIIVDASPEGQWLGVDISLEPRPLILVRPHSISEEAQISP